MKENEILFGEPMIPPIDEVPDEVRAQWAEEDIARQEYEDIFGEPMIPPIDEVPDEVRAQWAEEDQAMQDYFNSIDEWLDYEMGLDPEFYQHE